MCTDKAMIDLTKLDLDLNLALLAKSLNPEIII